MVLDATGYKHALDMAYAAQMDGKKLAMLICGMDGVGKNEIAEQWAAEKDVALGGRGDIYAPDAKFRTIIVKPGQGDSAGDFLGMPKLHKVYPDPFAIEAGEHGAETHRYTAGELAARVRDKWGKTMNDALELVQERYEALVGERTVYSLPDFWPTSGQGLLILDELNRGGQNTESALLEVVRERKLSLANYVVPTGWVVIGLINPPTASFIGTREMDAAMESRFIVFNYRPRNEDWFEYAKKAELNPDLLRFLKENPNFLGNDIPENPIIKNLQPRPRRMTMLGELMQYVKPEDPIFQDVLEGTLGPTGATTFSQWLNQSDKPISGEDILKRWSTVKETVERYVAEGKNDLIAATTDNLLDYTEKHEELSAKWQTNLMNYMECLKADTRMAMASKLGYSEKGTNNLKHWDMFCNVERFNKICLAIVEDSEIKTD